MLQPQSLEMHQSKNYELNSSIAMMDIRADFFSYVFLETSLSELLILL